MMFFLYQCPIRAFTGVPCPGCGMMRAAGCLIRGDVWGAFDMHPLIFALPLFLLLIIFAKGRRKMYMIGAAAVIFIAVYAVRMALYFPHMPPMDYNYDSLLYSLIGK